MANADSRTNLANFARSEKGKKGSTGSAERFLRALAGIVLSRTGLSRSLERALQANKAWTVCVRRGLINCALMNTNQATDDTDDTD